MGEKASSEQFSNEWIDLFSDPDRFLAGKGILLEKEYPPPLRLVLWLEYFLTAGVESLKEIWGRLSLEEQKVLGIEILKCYLFQPLFVRIFPQEKSIKPAPPLLLRRQGKILTVERGTEPDGPDGEVWFYYPLVHHRLWPDLLTLFQGGGFSFEEVAKDLEPELTMAVSSHLEIFRRRAEALVSLSREKPGVAPSLIPEGQSGTEKTKIMMVEDAPVDKPRGTDLSEGLKPDQDLTPGPDLSSVQPAAPKKRKKKKPAPDQMKLF